MLENGDTFRDTVALTVRGDGVDIPPFTIVHTSKNATVRSGRRCAAGDSPVKGMYITTMISYVNHIAKYVDETSLLLMDRLSSHSSIQVRNHIESILLPDGQPMFIPLYFPAKTPFLISPLDMGAISAFKSNFYKLDRSSIPLKLRAVTKAWDKVSNEALRNICLNCGIVGEESIESLRIRFMREVVSEVPPELQEHFDFFEAWKTGVFEVEGATRGRGVRLDSPQQLGDTELDGVYWNRWGRK